MSSDSPSVDSAPVSAKQHFAPTNVGRSITFRLPSTNVVLAIWLGILALLSVLILYVSTTQTSAPVATLEQPPTSTPEYVPVQPVCPPCQLRHYPATFRPFNVVCPYCRNAIRINPPTKGTGQLGDVGEVGATE